MVQWVGAGETGLPIGSDYFTKIFELKRIKRK